MSTPRPRRDARRQQERPHVLIVTDDSSLASFLGEGLVMGGFWTSVISHGLQVLEVFRLRQFDLIVLDYELANFEAMELLQRLRGRSSKSSDSTPRTSAPIIIMASQAIPSPPEGWESLGVEHVLTAPVELEDVVHALHAAFATWRERHPDAPLADESGGS